MRAPAVLVLSAPVLALPGCNPADTEPATAQPPTATAVAEPSRASASDNWLADGEPAPAPDPAQGLDLDDARAGVGYRELDTVGDGAVQEIVSEEIAEANAKYWEPETISNELVAGPLARLKVICLGPWGAASTPPTIEEVFTDDARIAPLVPAEFEAEEVTHGVTRRRWTGESEYLGRAEWLAQLEGLFESSKRVRWALWKPAEVRVTDFGAEAILKVRFNRELPNGGIEHVNGKWKTEWVPAPPVSEVGESQREWRCRLAQPYKECSTLASAAPHFVDATLEAFGDTSLDPRLPTSLDGVNRALALADLDADGDLDLVVTLPLTMLYNRGDGTFEERTSQVLRGKNKLWNNDSEFFGILVQDFDRDGDLDLFSTVKRDHCLLFRQQDGAFHPEAIEAAYADNIPASVSAHDVDGDGWLDVFVSGYGPFVHPGPNNPANATNAYRNQMLRGLPEGKFEDVTDAWGFREHGTRWTFIGAFGDADGDGDIDLYTANDFGPNVLYRRMQGDGVTFRAELEDAEKIDAGFSMSATFADLDGDLDQDLYVSNMSSTAAQRVMKMDGDPREERLGVDMNNVRAKMSKGNTIILNEDSLLVEASAERGAKGASWAWGTALFDYDCDGDIDISSLNGMWTQGADDGRDL